MSSLNNIRTLLETINCVQDEYKCPNCKQNYNKKWYNKSSQLCIFCINFLPMRDTYSTILRDIDWYALKFDGDNSKEEFYKDFLSNLKKWADRFHVFPTTYDLMQIEELINQ